MEVKWEVLIVCLPQLCLQMRSMSPALEQHALFDRNTVDIPFFA